VDLSAALSHTSTFAYAAVFIGGLLSTLTPCVFPLIPITVSIFGARHAKRKMVAALLSGSYVLGIAVMYTALGMAAAATGTVFGRVMGNPWVITAIAALFIVFALSMFGVFEIALPSKWSQWSSHVGGAGVGGAFGMGLVAGVIAAPCTGPILAAVLTYVATTQKLFFGSSLLFVYALGMGLPFFVVGTFAVSLPKSGAWMGTVKSIFGIVMLIAALYFLKDVFPVINTRLPTTLAFRMILAFALLFGLVAHVSSHALAGHRSIKILTAALVVASAHLAIISITRSSIPAYSAEEWAAHGPEALVQARLLRKPVIIDFSADWCAACKELELKTYPSPNVAEELKRFVFIKVDDEEGTAVQRYGGVGLPYVIFFDSQGHLLEDYTITGFRTPGELLSILRRVN